MNRSDCLSEKISARSLGLFLLPISLLLAFFGGLILPVVGFFFALPFVIMSGALIFVPESKACRLLTEGAKKAVAKS